MPRIVLTPRANQDLEDVFEYLESQQSHLSDRFAKELDEACALYASQPLMGASSDEIAPNLRHFAVWNYVVFYRPTPDGLEIIRILHGARDLPRFFP